MAKRDLKEQENDLEALKKAEETLLTAAQKIGEILYKEAQDKNDDNSGPAEGTVS